MSEYRSSYRERAKSRRKSENIVDLRPKDEYQKEQMYLKLLDRGGNAYANQRAGEREQAFRAEQEAAREGKILEKIRDAEAKMRKGRKSY